MEIALAISSLIFILFLIACGLTPSNLEPVRKIYIIRTCDSSGYILSDDFCYYTCPLVTNLRLNGHVCIYDSDTESYIERKCYSYRLAQAIYNSNISDKCQFDIIYSSVGFERFLFPIRLICEQSYNYFVSSWILLLIVVLIDLFKKESAFPIDSIKMKDVLKIALPITILILFFNILYWIELSKINCI